MLSEVQSERMLPPGYEAQQPKLSQKRSVVIHPNAAEINSRGLDAVIAPRPMMVSLMSEFDRPPALNIPCATFPSG